MSILISVIIYSTVDFLTCGVMMLPYEASLINSQTEIRTKNIGKVRMVCFLGPVEHTNRVTSWATGFNLFKGKLFDF